MSLVVSDLKDAMIAATEGLTDGPTALSELGNAIATYIKNNAVVSFAWAAALPNPPFTPDPTTTASGAIVSLSFSLTQSGATEQSVAIAALKTQFIAGLTAATYNITDSGFTTTPGAMTTSPSLALLTINVSGDNRATAMEQFATNIINWVKAQLPTAPCAGSHTVGPLIYVGSGVPTGIS